ncbi:MAG TPA: hypothetical protein VGH76_15495, partial [Actinomycetospora sp.]|uniref:hypothetical protein n=1 Tax=Actinomycetospora sp. TaxID=1872135 RepID=UPI002F419AD7
MKSEARIAAASGFLFVGLFVAALVLLHRAPHLDDPDSTYTAFYAHGGDTLFVAIGLYLVPLAGIAFLWHMTAIRSMLDTLTPRPSGMAHGLNLLAGTIFVTMLFAGTAAVGAVAFATARGGPATLDPDTAWGLTAVGYGLVFVFAVRGAGMFALTTTTLLRQPRRPAGLPALGGSGEGGGAGGLGALPSVPAGSRPGRSAPGSRSPEADAVWELLQSDAVVYVCGNAATMAPGVRAALAEVFRAKTATSEAD